MTASVAFKQALPIRIAEWLTEHGYGVAKTNDRCVDHKPCWVEARSIQAADRWIGVLHGLERPGFLLGSHRRVVACLYLGASPGPWIASLFGSDPVASLFKRVLDELASAFEVHIEATQTTTENVRERRHW